MTKFRFKKQDLGVTCAAVYWDPGYIVWSGYTIDSTVCCVVLRKLVTPARWFDLEQEFGMHSSQMSEIFWKPVAHLCQTRQSLLNLRLGLLRRRAMMYGNSIFSFESTRDRCVGFLDCTKISIVPPEGIQFVAKECLLRAQALSLPHSYDHYDP